MPMSCTVTDGTAICCGTALTLCEHGPSEHGKDAGGDDQAHKPGAAEDAVFGQFGAAREQNGEDNKDGDGADVDENLRKAGELRVELQKQQRQPGKGHRDRERAVNQVLEQHRRQAAGQREGRKQIEDRRSSFALLIQHSGSSWGRSARCASAAGP